jgi:uncharacterized membrane protein YfbV (UPF0208 family)
MIALTVSLAYFAKHDRLSAAVTTASSVLSLVAGVYWLGVWGQGV